MYVAETSAGSVKKLSTDGIVTDYISGQSSLRYLALDQMGTLYVTCYSNGLVKQIFKNGTVVTISGFSAPYGIDVDMNGNIYVSEL